MTNRSGIYLDPSSHLPDRFDLGSDAGGADQRDVQSVNHNVERLGLAPSLQQGQKGLKS
jgi:hypothetical protein